MKKPDELKRFGPGDEEEETKTSQEPSAEVATNQEATGEAASE